MVENRCSVSHKYGPFIINKDKTSATRECLCCGKVTYYEPIGDDILEAVIEQENANFFKDPIVYKEFNGNSDEFTRLVDFLLSVINYLYVKNEVQDTLIKNMDYYNKLLSNKDSFNYKLVDDVIKYLKIYFAKDRYESKFGANSFSEEENSKMDELYDDIYKRYILFNEKYDKKNHLLR